MLVTESYLLYELENFIADIGGFLGLLLGASILSIIQSSIMLMKRSISKKIDV